MKVLGIALILCCSVMHAASIPKKQSQTAPVHADYSKGVFLGTREIRIFPDDPRKTNFTLITSWIPGAEHKGFFRYQLFVFVMDASASDKILFDATPPEQGWGIPETIDRLQKCLLFLNTYDDGGFVLQKIPLFFTTRVDDHGVATGLSANDSSQMDLNNYQSFLAAKPDSSWEIDWSCPTK